MGSAPNLTAANAYQRGGVLWYGAAACRLHSKTSVIGNERVLRIITNNTVDLFLKTATVVLEISNHISFRVLFDKLLPNI